MSDEWLKFQSSSGALITIIISIVSSTMLNDFKLKFYWNATNYRYKYIVFITHNYLDPIVSILEKAEQTRR